MTRSNGLVGRSCRVCADALYQHGERRITTPCSRPGAYNRALSWAFPRRVEEAEGSEKAIESAAPAVI